MNESLKGLFAGIVIALGGHVFLMSPDKVTGAFLFSIGLLTVVIFNLSLCTGKMCFIKSYEKKLYIPMLLYMNAMGATLIGIADKFNPSVTTAAIVIVNNKMNKGIPQLLVDSIMCTLFIGIGVVGYKKTNTDGFIKYAIIIMSVMGFVLSGSEHIIANMYYFIASSTSFPYNKCLLFVLVNYIGNMIGGLIICAMSKE